jgi:hypothetical protein
MAVRNARGNVRLRSYVVESPKPQARAGLRRAVGCAAAPELTSRFAASSRLSNFQGGLQLVRVATAQIAARNWRRAISKFSSSLPLAATPRISSLETRKTRKHCHTPSPGGAEWWSTGSGATTDIDSDQAVGGGPNNTAVTRPRPGRSAADMRRPPPRRRLRRLPLQRRVRCGRGADPASHLL